MPGNGVCKLSRNTCWNVVKSEFTHDKARSLPTRTTGGGDTPGLFVHQTQLFVRWRRRALASYRVRRVPDIAGAAEDCVCIHCLSVQWLLHVRAVAGSHRTEASVMSRITWPEGKILSQNPKPRLLFRQDLYKYVNYWPVGVQDGRWLGQESLVLYVKMRHQAVMEGSSPPSNGPHGIRVMKVEPHSGHSRQSMRQAWTASVILTCSFFTSRDQGPLTQVCFLLHSQSPGAV